MIKLMLKWIIRCAKGNKQLGSVSQVGGYSGNKVSVRRKEESIGIGRRMVVKFSVLGVVPNEGAE